MIRRMFWIGTGALLGVVGYRQATRVARALFPPVTPGDAVVSSGSARQRRELPRWRASRRDSSGRHALPGEPERGQLAGDSLRGLAISGGLVRGVARGGIRARRRARGAAGFARDVRRGMDLYMDHHADPAGPTLVGQQARVAHLRRADAGAKGPEREYPGDEYAKDGR
jgi:hypothetical protein